MGEYLPNRYPLPIEAATDFLDRHNQIPFPDEALATLLREAYAAGYTDAIAEQEANAEWDAEVPKTRDNLLRIPQGEVGCE